MSRIFILTALSVMSAIFLFSCSSPSPDAIAEKIERNEKLNADDYDAMLDYLSEATECLVPRLKEARTVEDMETIDADNNKRFPHTDLFGATLLHDYPHLSQQQALRLADIRTEAQKALSH